MMLLSKLNLNSEVNRKKINLIFISTLLLYLVTQTICMKKLLLLVLCWPLFAMAQTLPSIEEKTKNFTAYPGFIKFYWDANAGKIFMEINKFDSVLLYQTSLPAGLGSNDIGLDRGKLGTTAVVKFTRVGNKILMVQPNYDFRANTNDVAEKRAVEQSFFCNIIGAA